MKKKQSNRKVTITLSEKEFSTLNLLATTLNISVPEFVRSLVSGISPPQNTKETLKEWALEGLNESVHIEKPYRIREGYDAKRLEEICNELITNKKGGKTLGTEIMTQLIEEDHPREILTRTTEKRLLRWTHPGRVDYRTRFVTPRAREMCKILFGGIPSRMDLFF